MVCLLTVFVERLKILGVLVLNILLVLRVANDRLLVFFDDGHFNVIVYDIVVRKIAVWLA